MSTNQDEDTTSPRAVIQAAHDRVAEMLGLWERLDLLIYSGAHGSRPEANADEFAAGWLRLAELAWTSDALVWAARPYLNVGKGTIDFGLREWPNWHEAAECWAGNFFGLTLVKWPTEFQSVSSARALRQEGVNDGDAVEIVRTGFCGHVRAVWEAGRGDTSREHRRSLQTHVACEYRDAISRYPDAPTKPVNRGGRPVDDELDRLVPQPVWIDG